eukprot:COSAG01_NODE_3774_length_5710_cov_18.325610_5_plen_792_part_00
MYRGKTSKDASCKKVLARSTGENLPAAGDVMDARGDDDSMEAGDLLLEGARTDENEEDFAALLAQFRHIAAGLTETGETELAKEGTEPPPEAATGGFDVATDPVKQHEEHHGNSGGEHLPAAGFAPEQPDEGQQLTAKKKKQRKGESDKHHGNSGGEHLPAAGDAVEQPDNGTGVGDLELPEPRGQKTHNLDDTASELENGADGDAKTTQHVDTDDFAALLAQFRRTAAEPAGALDTGAADGDDGAQEDAASDGGSELSESTEDEYEAEFRRHYYEERARQRRAHRGRRDLTALLDRQFPGRVALRALAWANILPDDPDTEGNEPPPDTAVDIRGTDVATSLQEKQVTTGGTEPPPDSAAGCDDLPVAEDEPATDDAPLDLWGDEPYDGGGVIRSLVEEDAQELRAAMDLDDVASADESTTDEYEEEFTRTGTGDHGSVLYFVHLTGCNCGGDNCEWNATDERPPPGYCCKCAPHPGEVLHDETGVQAHWIAETERLHAQAEAGAGLLQAHAALDTADNSEAPLDELYGCVSTVEMYAAEMQGMQSTCSWITLSAARDQLADCRVAREELSAAATALYGEEAYDFLDHMEPEPEAHVAYYEELEAQITEAYYEEQETQEAQEQASQRSLNAATETVQSTPTRPPPATSTSPVFTPTGDAGDLAADTADVTCTLFEGSSDDYDIAMDDGAGAGLGLDAAHVAACSRAHRVTALKGSDTHDVELMPADEPLIPAQEPMTVETALQLTLGSSTLKSNAKSNNIVTTQKPTGYLRPYGRPPDGPATHTHLHGSLW